MQAYKKERGECSIPATTHRVSLLHNTDELIDATRMMPIAWTTSPPSHCIESPREKNHIRCPMSGLDGVATQLCTASLTFLTSGSRIQNLEKTGSNQWRQPSA